MALYRIGEFSKITGLTVKTLRFYDEQGVLKPSLVEPGSGYRYYETSLISRAHAVTLLRSLEFSLAEITDLLSHSEDDARDVLDILRRQQDEIRSQITRYQQIDARLSQFIHEEQETRQMAAHESFTVEEKNIEPLLIAGIRIKGRYADCGAGFAKIDKSLGRDINGKPLLLHYDTEYREEDADFVPVSKSIDVAGIDIRELPAGRCVSLLHRGPSRRPAHLLRQSLRLRPRTQPRSPTPHARSLPQRPRHDLPRQPQQVPHRDSTLRG